MYAVIYRWKLKQGKEEPFIQSWKKGTERFRDARGGLGSRLHKAEDGTWIAYAQWPNKQTYLKAQEKVPGEHPEFQNTLDQCVEKIYDPIFCELQADLFL